VHENEQALYTLPGLNGVDNGNRTRQKVEQLLERCAVGMGLSVADARAAKAGTGGKGKKSVTAEIDRSGKDGSNDGKCTCPHCSVHSPRRLIDLSHQPTILNITFAEASSPSSKSYAAKRARAAEGTKNGSKTMKARNGHKKSHRVLVCQDLGDDVKVETKTPDKKETNETNETAEDENDGRFERRSLKRHSEADGGPPVKKRRGRKPDTIGHTPPAPNPSLTLDLHDEEVKFDNDGQEGEESQASATIAVHGEERAHAEPDLNANAKMPVGQRPHVTDTNSAATTSFDTATTTDSTPDTNSHITDETRTIAQTVFGTTYSDLTDLEEVDTEDVGRLLSLDFEGIFGLQNDIQLPN